MSGSNITNRMRFLMFFLTILLFSTALPADVDLKPEGLKIDPVHGKISFSVRNSGSETVSRVAVRLKVRGNSENLYIANLPAQNSLTVTAVASLPCNTSEEVTIIVDPENTIAEANKMNNRILEKLKRECLPDLVALRLESKQQKPALLLQNIGSSASTPTTVIFRAIFNTGAQVLSTEKVESIAPGAQLTVLSSGKPECGVLLRIKAEINPEKLLRESNDQNNESGITNLQSPPCR